MLIIPFDNYFSVTNNKNLITCFGACTEKNRLIIVSELMAKGSIDKILQTEKLSLRDIVKIALDTANGLKFLHSCHIIHRDIKSKNLLVIYSEDIYIHHSYLFEKL